MNEFSFNIIESRRQQESQYWKQQLPPGEIVYGLDWVRRGNPTQPSPAHRHQRRFVIPAVAAELLGRIARNKPENVHALLMAVMQVMYYKYTPAASANPLFTPLYEGMTRGPQEEDLLPVWCPVEPGDTFARLIQKMQAAIRDAFVHRHYPVGYLWNKRYGTRQNYGRAVLLYDGVHSSDASLPAQAEIVYHFRTEAEEMILGVEYTHDYYHGYVENTAQHFIQLIEGLEANRQVPLRSISILTSNEVQRLLYRLNPERTAAPRWKGVVQWLHEHAVAMPDKQAFADEAGVIGYGALAARVSALAGALCQAGVLPGAPVALLMERSVDMASMILAIWQAGAVYIPIDAKFPLKRIELIVRDADALLVTTGEIAVRELRDSRLTNVVTVEMLAARLDAEGPGVGVFDDGALVDGAPAYIIYTSGSTGNPKGAMITHAGMVNQLQEKGRDCHLSADSIVAQTGSHVFDISIWQFFAALLKGGTTVICSEATVKDAAALTKVLREQRITHFQVVPSYLVALLEYLKSQPVSLPHMQMMVSAGEELRVYQVSQWLDLYPQIPILNAYGPTEASIDVLHYLLRDKPAGFIPIGKPLKNTAMYIVDQDMNLCPEGVRGEICIAGTGTGIGYLNNPVKTSLCFVINPFGDGAGAILYKTGDIGCWLPDGNIRFFGRRDHQVKIRGHRIELSEVENQLLRDPAVKEAVVVAGEAEDGQRFLSAYLRLSDNVTIDSIRQGLGARVPDYMVPAWFQRVDGFEKLPSGKIDRKALPVIARREAGEGIVPQTEAEVGMAAIWRRLLGVSEVRLQDNFFRLGGDSIRAIQLASRLRTEGWQVTIEDIFTHPTLVAMAASASPVVEVFSQDTVEGRVELTPVQHYFFDRYDLDTGHYNQAVLLELLAPVTDAALEMIVSRLSAHHDGLRMRYHREEEQIAQYNAGLDYPVSFQSVDLSGAEDPMAEMEAIATRLQASIDVREVPLMRMAVFHHPSGDRLLIVLHHLVTDGVSWRILLEDLRILLQQYSDNELPTLPLKTSSVREWAASLKDYMATDVFLRAAAYWEKEALKAAAVLPMDMAGGEDRFIDMKVFRLSLDEQDTSRLLAATDETYGVQPQELMLTALLMAAERSFCVRTLCVDLEGHGREAMIPGIDISRTVGWFTSIFPVTLEWADEGGTMGLLRHNKRLLRAIPNRGFDFLLWKYGGRRDAAMPAGASVLFNYLGRFDTDVDNGFFRSTAGSFGPTAAPHLRRTHPLEMVGVVTAGRLHLHISYGSRQFTAEHIGEFAAHYGRALRELSEGCCGGQLLSASGAEEVLMLSPAQEGILYHALLEPTSLNYFVQIAYQVHSAMDVAAMEAAFRQLLQRHDILRARFVWEHEQRPVQVIGRQTADVFFFRDLAEEGSAATADTIRHDDLGRRFDLRDGGLIRLTVVRRAPERFELIWSFHHILMDGWCTNILAREFLVLYHALLKGERPLLPVAIQYGRYIDWLGQRDQAKAAAWWAGYLRGFDSATVLPLREKINREQGPAVREEVLLLDEQRSAGIRELALAAGVTTYTILQTAWALLLSFYNDNDDVVFGSVVAGRPAELEGIESMIGLFINTIPVRIRVEAGTRLFDCYRAVQRDALRSHHADFYPLAKIQAASGLAKHLVGHILVYENYPLDVHLAGVQTGGTENLDVPEVKVFEQTNYPLSVIIAPGRSIRVKFQYRPDALDEETITTMANRYRHILRQLLDGADVQVKAIDPLLTGEAGLVGHRFNSTRRQYPLQYNVEELFRKRVLEMPDRIAVEFREEALSYSELDKLAGKLAAVLTATGCAAPGKAIGLLVHRGAQTVAAILGILRAGAAYVPISPYLPASRMEYIIRDSGCELIVCNKALERTAAAHARPVVLEDVLAEGSVVAPASVEGTPAASPDDLIYLIYTSGSTGRPKGVTVTHRNVVNLLYGLNEIIYSRYESPARLALLSPFDFDASVQHLFGALILGHTLCIVEEDARADGALLLEFLGSRRIDIADGTPTHLRLMLESGEPIPAGLRHLLIAGEELSKALVMEFYARRPGVVITNLYGPTEACVDATYFHIRPEQLPDWQRIPIGRPLPNQQVYVLNRHRQLLPPGVTGDVYIGGEGISRGYHGLPELTEERFIPNPFRPGERMYRTGDLGKWLPGGDLLFAGRADNQVKIRGFRIEPGEIECQLKEVPGILDVVVMPVMKGSSVKLCAWYTASTDPTAAGLRAFAESRLPYYMVPSYFNRVPQMPLTSTNKTDVQALLAIQPEADTGRHSAAPASRTEETLADIWKDVLQLKTMGRDDNFFEAGGNSIDLVRVYGQMKTKLNFDEPLVRLIEFPTIQSMAAHLGETLPEEAVADPQRVQQANKKKLSQRALRKMALDPGTAEAE